VRNKDNRVGCHVRGNGMYFTPDMVRVFHEPTHSRLVCNRCCPTPHCLATSAHSKPNASSGC
jgi:hypothetical protein